jgi:tetratricopeptide (TPR) repeat protein
MFKSKNIYSATMETINLYLHQAAEENMEAALLLSDGCVAQAMPIFQNALSILDQLRPLDLIFKASMNLPFECTSVDVPYLEDDHYFAYHRAVIFSTKTISPLYRNLNEIDFYRGVVIFNMALATHMRGNVLKEEKTMHRAVHLYNESLNAFRNIPLGDTTTDLLRVAALNMTMIIHSNMGEYQKAKESLDDVRDHWRHALVLEFQSEAFGKEDIEGFILNTLEMLPPTAAACA